jgi:2'-5' RNA ligase
MKDLVKCAMLELHNPCWQSKLIDFVDKYEDAINEEKCDEEGLYSLYENECHVTLLYGLAATKIQCLRALKDRGPSLVKLSKSNVTVSPIVINTFDDDEFRVLKLDLSECSAIKELTDCWKALKGLPNDSKFDEYSPHITITYLKPTVTDDEIAEMAKFFEDMPITDWTIMALILSYQRGQKELIKLRQA